MAYGHFETKLRRWVLALPRLSSDTSGQLSAFLEQVSETNDGGISFILHTHIPQGVENCLFGV